jgi:hypothetical protein
MTHRARLLAPALFALALALAACAPRASETPNALNSPEARQLEQTATIAYHRMEIGFLQTGEYTTNVLIDLALPQGVRWTLEEFSSTDYSLRFTSSAVPDFAWLVSPRGVRVTNAGG